VLCGQASHEGDSGVVSGQFLKIQRGTVRGDGRHISSRSRPGERHRRPELGHVVESRTSQAQQSVQSHTRRRAYPPGLPE
jgi:hypothetical protein